MLRGTGSDADRKILAILKILNESSSSIGSVKIARQLERYGIPLTDRAVRYHLKITDERGYTQFLGRRNGRMLTTRGLEELKMARAPEQMGFILDKLELLAFQTTFDPRKRRGLLPINTSLINKNDFKKAISIIKDVLKAGLGVSHFVATAGAGEKLGSVVVPQGQIGLATVCSVTVNGVLLKAGVPIESKFAGVLEMHDHKPSRFVAIIDYSGTSIDPSEQYIRAGMVNVSEAVRTGNGKILANFREIPAPARAIVEEESTLLKEAGINGIMALGNTSEPMCQIAVGLNRVGAVLLGGLNPMAAVVEAGISVENTAESGMIDFSQLKSIWELENTSFPL